LSNFIVDPYKFAVPLVVWYDTLDGSPVEDGQISEQSVYNIGARGEASRASDSAMNGESVRQVKCYLKKATGASGTITCKVSATSDNTTRAVIGTYEAGDLSTSYELITFGGVSTTSYTLVDGDTICVEFGDTGTIYTRQTNNYSAYDGTKSGKSYFLYTGVEAGWNSDGGEDWIAEFSG
jgi:hypothetical protein